MLYLSNKGVYVNRYNQEHYKNVSVRFNWVSERDIIDHLKSKKSLKAYLVRLIRQDMKIEKDLEREKILNGFDFGV